MSSPELPLDRAALIALEQRGVRLTHRYFWGHRARPGGALSNSVFSQWWPARFDVDGESFLSAEHFMMVGKARLFGDEESARRILAAATPEQAKALGRAVNGFTEEAWSAHRFDLVTAGNLAKFSQDPALRAYLLETGNEVLVEASPVDFIWGIGLEASDPRAAAATTWRGENLLGFALMRVRELLRGRLPAPSSVPARG